ncbi:MAG: aminodeoxyfutalosine synthase [Candidatus Thalassarchaeaceae archaeon]|jgi:aminodeoxyfutalosine synthase|tara:strand:- start:960 stop:2201 length:1242 start_codon:yes stop_codon:yes gene_type:complete
MVHSDNISEVRVSMLFIENLDWREKLSELEIPISVENDPLFLHCLEILKSGGRIGISDGLKIYNSPNFPGLCALADLIKQSRFSKNIFFNENLHVNTTNICVLACRFCAFRKGPRHADAYELSIAEFLHRIAPYADIIDEVHSVGGLHPRWTVEHYVNLYKEIKDKYPHIHVKSLTAVEIKHISSRSGLSVYDTLKSLKEAGLNSIPGGGAEILVDSVRDRICRGKENSAEYLEIHGIAHSLDIPSNCTMLFGTVETVGERLIHLDKLRKLQDETSGFQCFVPYPFLPDKTRLPEAQLATTSEIVRVIAISRIMLDNISHIKAYRMNIGDYVATLSIKSGADDIDGTVGHEEIMHEAGSKTRLDFNKNELSNLVKSCNLKPIKRNSIYTKFEEIFPLQSNSITMPLLNQEMSQ